MAIKRRVNLPPKRKLRIRPKPQRAAQLSLFAGTPGERDLPIPEKNFAAIIDYINKQGFIVTLHQIDLDKWQANAHVSRVNAYSVGMGTCAEEALWMSVNLHLKGGKW